MALQEELKELAANLLGRLDITDPNQPRRPPLWNTLLAGASPAVPRAPPVPVAVALCANREDVLLCVAFAVKHRLPLSSKGQGLHHPTPPRLCGCATACDVS